MGGEVLVEGQGTGYGETRRNRTDVKRRRAGREGWDRMEEYRGGR